MSFPPSSTFSFPIPSSFQELEGEPYDLLPYPIGFANDCDDEVTRANSFDALVRLLERGNKDLISRMDSGACASIGNDYDDGNDNECWNNEERVQALYTLVRKSASLSVSARKRLIDSICQAVVCLSKILSSVRGESSNNVRTSNTASRSSHTQNHVVVPQSFRDAFACHLYMLYTIMVFTEAEIKAMKALGSSSTSGTRRNQQSSKKQNDKQAQEAQQTQLSREKCAKAMHTAARAMKKYRSHLWQRGVPDEHVVGIPCRIAYQMLENATGITARKLACADQALEMIAFALDSEMSTNAITSDITLGVDRLSLGSSGGEGTRSHSNHGTVESGVLNTVVTALVDMLHSYEHMAPLVSELCCLVNEDPMNQLAVELLREIGKLDTGNVSCGSRGSAADSSLGSMASAAGIKNVAPFLNELAQKRPHLVLEHSSLILRHLRSEPYHLRSAIITSIGHILIQCVDHDDVNSSRTNPDGSAVEVDDSDTLKMQRKKREKTKASLYDILLEHVHDVSSYTRVATLKTWAKLIEAQALPVDKLTPITSLAIDRLKDKTVMVRRVAMQILTMVLENNPFTDSLSPTPYKQKEVQIREYILKNLPKHLMEAMKEAIDQIDTSEDDQSSDGCNDDTSQDKERIEIENAAINATISDCQEIMAANDEGVEDTEATMDDELVKQLKVFSFLRSAITFIELFDYSKFESMLLSSTKSDVSEALRFFVRARHFNLPCAVTGIKQALSLMWSNEESIQDEVLTAFTRVFIYGTDGEEKLPSNQIVNNLLKLVGSASISELASIEEAISRLVKKEIIPSEVFFVLWSIAAKASGKPRSVAMMILSMGATADAGIVDSASRLRHLLEAGFGEHTEEHRDWATVKSASYALQRVSRVKLDPTSAKFLVLEQIVEKLCGVIQGDWCCDSSEDDTRAWFGAADEAINALFAICPAPEQVAKIVIKNLEGSTFGYGFGNVATSCHSLRLSRFFFVISHLSLKLLVYTEALSSSVRNANAARTLAKQEEADKFKAASENSIDGNDDDIEAELGLAQAAEAETENKVAEIAEKEIIGRGLIGLFTPLLVRIVANENGQFSSEILMQSSVLALCKFMCISRTFCDNHLPLLFTKIAIAPKNDVTLRANTVIALGDLAFRFPNEVEPYTPRLYACLRDDSNRVRLHTLMVLTHLILNDMIKVKGQVCEIAMCLRDKEGRIRDMARHLFHKLSKRSNNPIYNLLPEIVSRLSSMSVKRDDFRYIMAFLLAFIQKERQSEMIVDKLCQRFPKCSSISQKANISYCLAQLKYNEKCIKLLNDHFKLYKDALFDEDVHKNFSSIVVKAKKFAKPEMKQYVEEWEAKIIEENATGMENEEANKKAKKAKIRASKRVTRAASEKEKIDEWAATEESEEGEENESEDEFEFDDKENTVPLLGSNVEVKQTKHGSRRKGRHQKLSI